jgi:hypothetical protein
MPVPPPVTSATLPERPKRLAALSFSAVDMALQCSEPFVPGRGLKERKVEQVGRVRQVYADEQARARE